MKACLDGKTGKNGGKTIISHLLKEFESVVYQPFRNYVSCNAQNVGYLVFKFVKLGNEYEIYLTLIDIAIFKLLYLPHL